MKTIPLLALLVVLWIGGSAANASSHSFYLTPKQLNSRSDNAKLILGKAIRETVTVFHDGHPTALPVPDREELERLRLEAYSSSDVTRSDLYKMRILYEIEYEVIESYSGDLAKGASLVVRVMDHPDSMCPSRPGYGKIEKDQVRVWLVDIEQEDEIPVIHYSWCLPEAFPKIRKQAEFDRTQDPFDPNQQPDPYDNGKPEQD